LRSSSLTATVSQRLAQLLLNRNRTSRQHTAGFGHEWTSPIRSLMLALPFELKFKLSQVTQNAPFCYLSLFLSLVTHVTLTNQCLQHPTPRDVGFAPVATHHRILPRRKLDTAVDVNAKSAEIKSPLFTPNSSLHLSA